MPLNVTKAKANILNDYQKYLSSLLTVRDPEISSLARRAVKDGSFIKCPPPEKTPPFVTGASLANLCDEHIASMEFSKIAKEIFFDRPLYLHQEKAFRKIVEEKKNIIVATGTGSGKTECYFLPIFDHLMKQAERSELKDGVQALLLFPMNALANDQVKKLRRLLADYPEITFGRYTGETLQKDSAAREDFQRLHNCKPLDNELLSRERMQSAPPHILLTNYAMLEYLLIRPADSVFFDGEFARNWSFIVADEAHSYKGAAGVEIALLLRRLKERINRNGHREIRCVATSATLGDENAKPALAQFSTALFGEPFEPDCIITGKVAPSGGEAASSVRHHMFIKSLEGMFLSLYPDKRVYLDKKELENIDGRAVAVFELAECQRCKQEYIVGKISADGYLRQVTDADQKLEYYLIQPKDLSPDVDTDEDEDEIKSDVKKLEKFILCTVCGRITTSRVECCDSNDDGKYIPVYKLTGGMKSERNTCVMCGSVAHGVLKRFLTSNHSATFAIANSLYANLPAQGTVSDGSDDDFFSSSNIHETGDESGRKLLVFSDNRQEAAFFAGYMHNQYERVMWRRLIINVLLRDGGGVRIDDLIDNITVAAEKEGLYRTLRGDRLSRQQKIVKAGQYVMYEFLKNDKSTGLSGRGFVDFYPERPEGFKASRWGLSPEETWNIFRFLMDTLRENGASTYPESVNPQDEFFSPYNREVYFRRETRASVFGKQILSFLPAKGRKNRRSVFFTRLLGSDMSSSALDDAYGILMQSFYKQGYISEEKIAKIGIAHQIDFKKWYARFVNDDDLLWVCNKCGKIFHYSVGDLCPEFKCSGSLKKESAGKIRADEYYNSLYLGSKIIPMAAQEHTAQLTKEAASRYQSAFEEGRINVLSCSTTFEMGVDIGELEAVFLRNVPPETSNYIQRAGRAGRRTDSSALAVTFARRNSHDLNFFSKPDDIINGHIAPPYLEIENDKIAARHVNSVVMAWFFKKFPEYFLGNTSSIVGYSGGLSAIDAMKEALRARPAEILEALREILPAQLFKRMKIAGWDFADRLIGDEGLLTKAITARKEELDELDRYKAERLEKGKYTDSIQRVINTRKDEQSISFLASNGVLPKYGFPVDVVELQILNNSPEAKSVELSRDLRLAIAEFAPPGQVVANGKIWTSRYVKTSPNKEWPTYRYYECPSCRHILSDNRITVLGENDEKETVICPRCGEEMKSNKYIVPLFGFSTAWEDKPESVGDERPGRGYSTRVQFHGIGELDEYQKENRKSRVALKGDRSVKIEYSPAGELFVLNRGSNGSGLWICRFCGKMWGFPPEKKDIKHKNKLGQDCTGTFLLQTSLGHKFTTDILRVALPDFSRFSVHEKSIPASVLYAVLDGASDSLGIQRSDIDGCLVYSSVYPSLVLFDEAAGGAGHMKHLYTRMEEVLAAAASHVDGRCGCSEETSCYGCLRNYGNQFEHEHLVRGGALKYLNWLTQK